MEFFQIRTRSARDHRKQTGFEFFRFRTSVEGFLIKFGKYTTQITFGILWCFIGNLDTFLQIAFGNRPREHAHEGARWLARQNATELRVGKVLQQFK